MIEFADEVSEETQRINELFSDESMEEHRREIDGGMPKIEYLPYDGDIQNIDIISMDKCVDNFKKGIVSNPINNEVFHVGVTFDKSEKKVFINGKIANKEKQLSLFGDM